MKKFESVISLSVTEYEFIRKLLCELSESKPNGAKLYDVLLTVKPELIPFWISSLLNPIVDEEG